MAMLPRFLLICTAFLALPTVAAAVEAVTVSPTRGPVSQSVTVTGSGWLTNAGEGVFIFISEIEVARAYPDANGAFSVSFVIPTDIPEGVQTISGHRGFSSVADAYTSFTVTASPPPLEPSPLLPGWYRNSGPSIIYKDSELTIAWKNSYVYPYPQKSALYWYAEVLYTYKGDDTFDIRCAGAGGLPPVREHMRGTPNAGYVEAEETLCGSDPDFTITLHPGERFTNWAIFHNVPWSAGEVSLEWAPYGSSAWIDPWHSSFDAPPPAVCPPELVRFRLCTPVSREPAGAAPNLVVLVHGCCTSEADVRNEWDRLGRKIADDLDPTQWEVVVWDWSQHTPGRPSHSTPLVDLYYGFGSLDDFLFYADYALEYAFSESERLSASITLHSNYDYIHLIGHSTGASVIHSAANAVANHYTLQGTKKPFIHLTFLDAYTPDERSSEYGNLLRRYPHYAEHYIDFPLPYTDTCLRFAFNFEITRWLHAELPHAWPRRWYEMSVTNLYEYGYGLARETGHISNPARQFPKNRTCHITSPDDRCIPEPCWK